jgi:hypothetical protein
MLEVQKPAYFLFVAAQPLRRGSAVTPSGVIDWQFITPEGGTLGLPFHIKELNSWCKKHGVNKNWGAGFPRTQ